ncbi:hypothetical protein BDR04DRAFT_1120637 [Suillus decipiens]|nr:hypothetical protein BDR04DRAFT_1120637 [Suillus decipiens]
MAQTDEVHNISIVLAKEQDIEPPYSIFTTCEKWLIVTLASIAGLFSPLTAYIYLPAIPMIATAFNKTVELTNLTVTTSLHPRSEAVSSASSQWVHSNRVSKVGPALGPVIGGALADKLGWSSACFIVMVTSPGVRFLPETLRSIVGNGSVFPPIQYRPLLPLIGCGHKDSEVDCPSTRKSHNPFRLFACVDVLNLLVFNGIQYAVTAKQQLIHNFTPEKGIPGHIINDDDFPIEATRLKRLPLWMIIFCAACTGYGWCFQTRTTIAVPLVLQFVIGFSEIAMLTTIQTLLIDLVLSQGSSVTACYCDDNYKITSYGVPWERCWSP